MRGHGSKDQVCKVEQQYGHREGAARAVVAVHEPVLRAAGVVVGAVGVAGEPEVCLRDPASEEQHGAAQGVHWMQQRRPEERRVGDDVEYCDDGRDARLDNAKTKGGVLDESAIFSFYCLLISDDTNGSAPGEGEEDTRAATRREEIKPSKAEEEDPKPRKQRMCAG